MTRDEVVRLKRSIWPKSPVRPVRIYAVLDCARSPSIYDLVARSYREKSCLFAGNLPPELERAAPFLLELQPGDSLTDEILLRGWQDAWGILVRTESTFLNLRRHLRTLLRVSTEDGRFHLFRLYDPRVILIYLQTCTRAELELIFGEAVAEILVFSSDLRSSQRLSFSSDQLLVEML